jgi:hypothetical protein
MKKFQNVNFEKTVILKVAHDNDMAIKLLFYTFFKFEILKNLNFFLVESFGVFIFFLLTFLK